MKNFFISLFMFFPAMMSAQYYDSADDILFYVNESDPLFCIVLNFDGDRATYFNHTYQHTRTKVSQLLNSDMQYFENKTSIALYNMSFTPEFDGTAYVFYKRRENAYSNSVYYDSYVMEFSRDREYLTYKTFPNKRNPTSNTRPSKIEKYKRVSKNTFVTRGRGR